MLNEFERPNPAIVFLQRPTRTLYRVQRARTNR